MRSLVGKLLVVVLMGRVTRATEGIIGEDQRGFRSGCMDQMFTLKQSSEKIREKKQRLCVGFMELKKESDTVNR